jgi:Trk-type K+ transport system membrane component
MGRRRAINEPRRRLRRAVRSVRARERAVEEEYSEFVPARRDSEVLARSRAGQAQIERRSPTRIVTISFITAIAIGTILLLLPGMRVGGIDTPLGVALFTATSAVCVTGLTVVDTATFWTPLGQVVILLLIQVGGFGIQALGTLWIMLLNRRLGATSRLLAQTETGAMTPGEVRRTLQALAVITIIVEAAVALMLWLRFMLSYGEPAGTAAWHAVFHSISAFNNAGFALQSDSLMTFGHDFFVLAPISAAIVIGGLGFLVVVELFARATGERGLLPHRRWKPMSPEQVVARGRELARRSKYRLGGLHPERFGFGNPIPLSLHTRLTLIGTGIAMVVGAVGFALFEWRNPSTLGTLPWWERLVQSVFSGAITPRTAGFNTVDYASVQGETRFLTDGLMFTGASSGSTAGGVKVTTIVVLAVAVRAEIRGHKDVNVLDRRIPEGVVRIAIAVVMVSLAAIMAGTMALIYLTDLTLDRALFEVVSALATVGLSANVTPTLPEGAQLMLVGLMLLGRVGPLTLVSSLSLRTSPRAYRLPPGQPMIG